jgi:hypothetical protein
MLEYLFNDMKKFVYLIIVSLLCTLLALWSPWVNWRLDLIQLFGVVMPDQIASLQVYSLAGDIEVSLNNEFKGIAKFEDNEGYILDRVDPGEQLITLTRVSTVEDSYWSFSKMIKFEAGTSVVLSFNLGPEEDFSEGHIIYAVKKDNLDSVSKLNIMSNVESALIQVDTTSLEQISERFISFNINLDSQKQVTISRRGYETLKFTILPDTQDERDKLKDYDLNLEAHLMVQPVIVE